VTLAVISHPSKQGNMYRIPAGAERAGFETAFLTGYYWRGPGLGLRSAACDASGDSGTPDEIA
jgi:hypothetical protein